MSRNNQEHSEDTEKFIKIASGDASTTMKLIEEFEISTSPDDKLMNKVSFTGLSKDEVLKYATDPYWVKVRWFIFAIFWILWLAMLIAAVLLIVFTPKCPFRPKLDWWQKDVLYQIDVSKFKDSNGDGVGDLQGIRSSLDYLKNLGVKTILLFNVVDKNQPDQFDPVLGNVDLIAFKKELKSNSINVVVDIPIETLGLTNEELKGNASSIISNWMNSFADGVRLTNMEKMKDLNLNSTESVLAGLHDVADQISRKTLNKKLLLFSSNNYDLNSKFNGYKPSFLVNTLFNGSDISEYLKTPEKLTEALNKNRANPNANWTSIMLSWNNNARLGNLKDNLNNLAQTILILLHGTPILFYGDELALKGENYVQSYMKWDTKPSCGFTTNLTIAQTINSKDTCESSVHFHSAHGAGETIIDLFKNLVKLRSQESFLFGKETILNETNVFSFTRDAPGFPAFLVAAHFNTESQGKHLINYHSTHSVLPSGDVEYYFSSDGVLNNDFQINKTVSTDRILLKYGEILVLRLKEETTNPVTEAFKPH